MTALFTIITINKSLKDIKKYSWPVNQNIYSFKTERIFEPRFTVCYNKFNQYRQTSLNLNVNIKFKVLKLYIMKIALMFSSVTRMLF